MHESDRQRPVRDCFKRTTDISIGKTRDASVHRLFGSGADDDQDWAEKGTANVPRSGPQRAVSIECGTIVRRAQKPLFRVRATGMLHGRRRSADISNRRADRPELEHSICLQEFVRTFIRRSDLPRDPVAVSFHASGNRAERPLSGLAADDRPSSERRFVTHDLVRGAAIWTPHRKFQGTKLRQGRLAGQDRRPDRAASVRAFVSQHSFMVQHWPATSIMREIGVWHGCRAIRPPQSTLGSLQEFDNRRAGHA